MKSWSLAAAALAASLSLASPARATIVPVANGGSIATPSYTYTNNGTTDILADNALLYAIDPAGGGITFTRSFTAATTPTSNLSNSTTGTSVWNFQDTIAFTLAGPVNGDVLTATLNLANVLNISNLQIRLYGWANGTGVQNPILGAPSLYSPVPNSVVGWQSAPNGSTTITASFANVPTGTYYLDIRGDVTGSLGGSYVGILNVQPVPLPAGLPLLLSGLGLLGLRARRTA